MGPPPLFLSHPTGVGGVLIEKTNDKLYVRDVLYTYTDGISKIFARAQTRTHAHTHSLSLVRMSFFLSVYPFICYCHLELINKLFHLKSKFTEHLTITRYGRFSS